MGSAVMERVVERKPDSVLVQPAPKVYEVPTVETEPRDPHPLLPVFVAGAISLVLSTVFIGSVLAWLALRHSGVMAP